MSIIIIKLLKAFYRLVFSTEKGELKKAVCTIVVITRFVLLTIFLRQLYNLRLKERLIGRNANVINRFLVKVLN